jgi:ribonuclease T2
MLDLVLGFALAACAIPADLTPAPVVPQEESRIVPVTKLVLAYTWWPQECRRDDAHGTPGCAAGFGFRVHGLWPDGAGKTYPQFCRAPTRLDLIEVRRNYCMTPSTALLQHEWAKHGTCASATSAAYFAEARKVAASISLPKIDAPGSQQTAGSIRDAFLAVNPALPRQGLFVATDKNQWLTEVRVCLDLAYRPARCEGGDTGAPDSVPVRVWPR